MKEYFTQSMAWLHLWGGLLPGWMLFVIFFAGTLTCFDKEISHWMRPATHASSTVEPFSYDRSIQHLNTLAPNAEGWWLRGPAKREPLPVVGWINKDRPFEHRVLEADGRQVLANNTLGGELFFDLHYRLGISSDLGIWLVGAAGDPGSPGLLPDAAEGHVAIPADLRARLAEGVVLAVTDEPPGGSPVTGPTGAVHATGAITKG